MDEKFYICRICGNLVGVINDGGVPMMCCGEEMEALIPNTSDGAEEKHLPVVSVSGETVTVSVGKAAHPMEAQHSIEWIYVLTDKGGHRRAFKAGDEPKFTVTLNGEKALAAYAYCNLHGIWMTEI